MLLEMKNIIKIFDSVRAVDSVDFAVAPGEIHGLLGENGAGKTTLMNVLAGVLPRDGGEIIFDGQRVDAMTTRLSRDLGIRFIHQELNLFNHLTVYENIFFGEELTNSLGLLDQGEMKRQTRAVLESMHLDINPSTSLDELDASGKQLVEIAKAIRQNCKLLIMDEPTSALTNREIDNLFDIMRAMRGRGVSLIYISHKMPELFAVCNRYTVLRDGKLVGKGAFADTDESEITNLLVGKSIVSESIAVRELPKDPVLTVEGASCESFFEDVSFTLNRGEVLVFTGLTGDGRAELAEALFGIRRLTGGTVSLHGERLELDSIRSVMRRGVGMVQRNRKERSILPDMTIADNLSFASFVAGAGAFWVSPREEMARYEKNRRLTNIKADRPDRNLITSLSGGNQQKVILSRWLEIGADVYILDNPTQGIDVGAKAEVYKLIRDIAAARGKSIIVFSSEFREIEQIADRVLVMYKGAITARLDRGGLNEAEVMYHATGSDQIGEAPHHDN